MSKGISKDVRKAIKTFIDHVETLESTEDPEGNGFSAEYRLIQEAQIKNRKDNVFTTDVGKAENNLKKNRYKDILPYDDHRIVLSVVNGDPSSDYINASKLKGVRRTGGYIASQGPLAVTVNDFWRMIWEYDVEIVFMACRIVEMGKIKCKQYWNDLGKSEEFGDIAVYTEAEEEIMSDCIRRNFWVTKGEETRPVIQYHYSGWPDHGIPDDPGHIRDMIGYMRQTKHNDSTPLLVHCSAGCGRTGAIIAIDYVWTLLEEGLFDEKFCLFDLICDFREQRMSLVQTPEQYALVNRVLRTLCEEWLSKMASHTYENVEPDQTTYYNVEDNISKANVPAPGENIYEEAKNLQAEKSFKSLEKSDDRSEERKVNAPGVYQNVAENDEGRQEATHAARNDRMIHKTVIQVDAARSSHQTLASDKGGHKHGQTSSFSAPDTSPSSPKSPNSAIKAPAPPPASQKPQALANAVYSTINKKDSKVPVLPPDPSRSQPQVGDTLYSTISKKDSKVPVLPPDPSRSQPQAGDTLYSTISKKDSKVPVLPPDPSRSQPQAGDTLYSTINKKDSKVPVLPPDPSRSQSQAQAGDTFYTTVEKKRKAPQAPDKLQKMPGNEPLYSISKPVKPQPAVASRSQTSSLSEEDGGYTVIRTGSESTAYEDFDFPQSPINRNSHPGSPPGFHERLPRVRGPVPMPQSWNKVTTEAIYNVAWR